ncbi:MAG: hypothetical protein ABWY45_19820 [Mycobacterium sp.]
MKTQRNPLRWAFGLLAVACASVVLVAPPAHADPQGDATAAIDQAWTAAGGDTSPLGPRAGAVYPAGVGFGQDFINGAIFFSPATGARSVFGAILEKYRSLGGPADSDLGFPNIDEGPGRAPESRNVTFDGPDSPVIFWTPQTGAWVVRGIINTAWDRVGGSSGPLGVPTEDEVFAGESISQRFAGGQLTYDTAARTWTSTPPELAGQLADLQLPDDATSSIDIAWRVAGGPGGQLGAKDGDQYPVGDGTGQNFAGGKIFFSPETGAHVVSGTILEKYEAAGGPTGELGFPTANEVDGDVPGSRVSTFGAPDAPAIVWTPENGAVVVRGAMKAAWDKLGGSGGDLGVPLADQTGDDTVIQNFSGGQVTWNSTNNTFSTQPPELAEQLSGLEVPGQTTPDPSATPSASAQADNAEDSGGGSSWYFWVIALVVLLLGALVAWFLSKRRRDQQHEYAAPSTPAVDRGYDDDDDFDQSPKFDRDDDTTRDWSTPGADPDSGPDSASASEPDDTDYLASQPPWATREANARPWNEPVIPTGGLPVNVSGPDLFTHHGSHEAEDFNADIDESDPDSVDTAPTRVETDDDEQSGRHAAAADDSSPSWSADDDDDSYVPGPHSLFAPVYGAVPPPATGAADEFDRDADHEPGEAYGDYSSDYAQPEHSEPASTLEEYAPEGYAQPEYAQTEYAQPDYAQTEYVQPDYAQPDHAQHEYDQGATAFTPAAPEPDVAPPAIHLPLDDPDEAPTGYPVKGSMRTGTYHTPDSASFDVTVAEIWFASAELAEANGFTRAE